jgi:hypothetical protein
MGNKPRHARHRTPTVEQRRRAVRLDLAQYMLPCAKPSGSRPWTAEERALLGTGEDEVFAEQIDRMAAAVRRQRFRFGIPRPIPGGARRRRTQRKQVLIWPSESPAGQVSS